MMIGGHGLREHIRLLAPLFGLVAAVWALRMVLDFAGAPPAVVRACSVTVASPISILLAVLFIYFKRFGSYASVAASALLLGIWEQFLIIAAIAFTALTGIETIYAAPEYGRGLSLWHHILAHLTFALGYETLLGVGMGFLLLWILCRLVPLKPLEKGSG